MSRKREKGIGGALALYCCAVSALNRGATGFFAFGFNAPRSSGATLLAANVTLAGRLGGVGTLEGSAEGATEATALESDGLSSAAIAPTPGSEARPTEGAAA